LIAAFIMAAWYITPEIHKRAWSRVDQWFGPDVPAHVDGIWAGSSMGDIFRAGCFSIYLKLQQRGRTVEGLVGPDADRLHEIQDAVLTPIGIHFRAKTIDGELQFDLLTERATLAGYARRTLGAGKGIRYKMTLRKSGGLGGVAARAEVA
jgi:hypothetical protein